jgi:hypothetical protein
MQHTGTITAAQEISVKVVGKGIFYAALFGTGASASSHQCRPILKIDGNPSLLQEGAATWAIRSFSSFNGLQGGVEGFFYNPFISIDFNNAGDNKFAMNFPWGILFEESCEAVVDNIVGGANTAANVFMFVEGKGLTKSWNGP